MRMRRRRMKKEKEKEKSALVVAWTRPHKVQEGASQPPPRPLVSALPSGGWTAGKGQEEEEEGRR